MAHGGVIPPALCWMAQDAFKPHTITIVHYGHVLELDFRSDHSGLMTFE